MCLYNKPKAVAKFLSKHKNHNTVTVYKRLNYRTKSQFYGWDEEYVLDKKDALFAPYRREHEYKPGEIVSDSKARGICKKTQDISHGIHVYLSEKRAKRAIFNSAKSYQIVVRLTAQVKDLIGVDDLGVAVFKKVHLSRSEYNKHVKPAKAGESRKNE